jgi:peptidoglycan hydrolase CwlO-like protein
MSSAAVQQQLNQCRQDITACRTKIAKLENEIEYIEAVYDKRIRQQNNAYSSLDRRKASVGKYDGYKSKVFVSNSFGEHMQEMTHSETAPRKADSFGELADKLKRALASKENELAQEKSRLVRLQNSEVDLERDLNHWLRVEEEQRQAEATAAQVQSSNKGRY